MKNKIIVLGLIISAIVLFIIGVSLSEAKFGSNKRPKTVKYASKITNRGVILLNKKVSQKYLKNIYYVNLDYNYGHNRLAIKPTSTPNKDSVLINRTRKGKVIVIIDKNYLKNMGADTEVGHYYKCSWNPQRRVIVVECDKPVTRDKLE